MDGLFVPADFVVPLGVEGAGFVVRKLTAGDVERDFEAVMSSRVSLRRIFRADDDWPADGMTLQDNLADLERHEGDFVGRVGFTYSVVDPAGVICLGCVYIYPALTEQYDAEVYYWVRDSVKEAGLEERLGDFVRGWLARVWPFERVVFPGRGLSWAEWETTVPPEQRQGEII